MLSNEKNTFPTANMHALQKNGISVHKDKREGKQGSLKNLTIDNESVSSHEEHKKLDNPRLITLHDPDSPVSEEYRNLKSIIIKLTTKKEFHNTLMITSALSGEGKSISALNLAITLSREYDSSALLVDADLRRPSLHKYLDLTPDYGLSDCLMNGLNIDKAIINTGIDKLSILPAGNYVKNPAELQSSKKMKEFIAELKSRFSDRYIIIDTTPLLPFAESKFISGLVDRMILVVKEEKLSLNSVQDALDIIKGNGNLLGIIYNNVSVDNLNGHYQHHYKRYSHYDRYKRRQK